MREAYNMFIKKFREITFLWLLTIRHQDHMFPAVLGAAFAADVNILLPPWALGRCIPNWNAYYNLLPFYFSIYLHFGQYEIDFKSCAGGLVILSMNFISGEPRGLSQSWHSSQHMHCCGQASGLNTKTFHYGLLIHWQMVTAMCPLLLPSWLSLAQQLRDSHWAQEEEVVCVLDADGGDSAFTKL